MPENLPPLRLLPTPRWDPPYVDADDELERADVGPHPLAQGTLALAFVLPGGLPARPEVGPRLRLLPGGRAGRLPTALDDDDFGPRPTGRDDLPDPRPWAARLGLAVLEVLAGDRPAPQLVRWTSPEVYGRLQTGVRRTGRTRAATRGQAPRATVRALRVDEPADGVAEATVVVAQGERVRALALRLEGTDGRWCCTQLALA